MPDEELLEQPENEPQVDPEDIEFGIQLEPPPPVNLTNATVLGIASEFTGFDTTSWITVDTATGNSTIHEPQMIKKESRRTKPKSKNGKVTLYDGSIVEEEEAVFIPRFDHYFHKDDKRIHKDYFSGDFIVIDNALCGHYKICKEITDSGELVITGYSYCSLNDISPYTKAEYEYLTSTNNPIVDYIIHLDLTDNPIFDKYFEVAPGGYFRKDSDQIKHFHKCIKKGKVMGRKVKSVKSFRNYILENNLPLTYVNTLGLKYTFGLEVETSSGLVPKKHDKFLYYDAVYDGSLKHDDDGAAYGLEYVTDVLCGDQGLKQFKTLCNVLNKYCQINYKCGVHTHIGGAMFSKENIVLMYCLYSKIENEVFSMLPFSRRENEYCRKLPDLGFNIESFRQDYNYNINKAYDSIVKVVSKKGSASTNINKKKEHPLGHKCAYDHSTMRYCWVNFVPAMFNTRGNFKYTIEFRPMSASMSYTKIKNWLLICMALVSVVENNKVEIFAGKVNCLADILTIVYGNNARSIIEHVEMRKAKFNNKAEDFDPNSEEKEYKENEIDNDLSLKKL